MSVLSLEQYTISGASRETFEPLLAEHLAVMREHPGLMWADGGRAEDDDRYVLLSEWRTQGDLDAWEATAEAAKWEESTDPLLAADTTRRRFLPGT